MRIRKSKQIIFEALFFIALGFTTIISTLVLNGNVAIGEGSFYVYFVLSSL